MHDLRERANYDAAAHAPDERTRYDLHTVTVPAHVLAPDQLRTVEMPNLRSPDTRTYDQRIDAEMAVLREALERLADSVTVLMLEREIAQLERDNIKIHVDYSPDATSHTGPIVQPSTITGGPITTVKGPIVIVDSQGNRWLRHE